MMQQNATRRSALASLLVALGDDELVLGHRDSEWTGHAPILEEDIAFSNIAQDEIGHALVWYSLHERETGRSADAMGFERPWQEFRCCRFVAYPKGDFAYTVMRQFLFDMAEQVRLRALLGSSHEELRNASAKILREESYHVMHSRGLLERLAQGTDDGHRRMQRALDIAFPQAMGVFEPLDEESEIVQWSLMPPARTLAQEWLKEVLPLLTSATLSLSISDADLEGGLPATADVGGRNGRHTEHLKQLVEDMRSVYQLAPGGPW